MKGGSIQHHSSVQEQRQARVASNQQKSIDDYKAEYTRDPNNQALVREYVKTLEEMKSTADRALEREDYSSACRDYRVLYKNFGEFKGFAHMLSFDRGKLNTKLMTCKDGLSKRGFYEYRQGNLHQAILLWQDYLTIDPYSADIKKALTTAKLQQKNLQQTK
jgi:tetratricopeptide (TPR) repeat protein